MKYGPKNLRISYGGKALTHFGGVFLVYQFFKKMRLRTLIKDALRFPQRNNRYSLPEMILALMYPMMLGLGRIETSHLLKRNGVFQYLTGLSAYPNPTALRRFLLRLPPQCLLQLRKLHEWLLSRLILKPWPPTSFLFDLDSTVLTLYGKQEGAKVGYNPKKRGRPSYHPLVCFEAHTKDFWHGELRPGDVHTGRGAVELLRACFSKLPASAQRVRVRGDVGFYDHVTIEYLEEKRAGYIIVAKITPPLQRSIPHRRFREIAPGLAVAEFRYQPLHWKAPHRFIAIRKTLPEDEPTAQLSLFTVERYSYHLFVTNLSLWPENAWRFYNGRAGVERIIRELKEDYPLAKIPTRDFQANEVYFHLLLLGYNFMNWFKRFCLPKDFHHSTVKTLREKLLVVPAELVRPGKRPTLKLPATFLYREAFDYALKRIQKFHL